MQAGVLYYYRASPSLRGGALEFCSKASKTLGWGDCGSDRMEPMLASRFSHALPRCKVPVVEGTLVAFSNYAAVHRVLAMQAAQEAPGSRDFIALFVIDQRRPLASPELGHLEARREARQALLQEQLVPRGRFGADSEEVYSTGNGSYADIGWRASSKDWWHSGVTKMAAAAKLERFNFTPPLDRGLSWCLEPQHSASKATVWNPESPWAEHQVQVQGGQGAGGGVGAGGGGEAGGGGGRRSFFAHRTTGEVCAAAPPVEEGVSLVCRFDSLQHWQDEWSHQDTPLWTLDPLVQELLGHVADR